jgi:hypothetical protein
VLSAFAVSPVNILLHFLPYLSSTSPLTIFSFPKTAQQATCSCGKQSALQCNCEKATTENSVSGDRCSCRARPAGKCNCSRSEAENQDQSQKPVSACGEECDCGCRESGKFLFYELFIHGGMILVRR